MDGAVPSRDIGRPSSASLMEVIALFIYQLILEAASLLSLVTPTGIKVLGRQRCTNGVMGLPPGPASSWAGITGEPMF